VPLLANFDRVAFVSDPLHAARARRYLKQQRPELAGRLVSAGDYRLLERWWLKVPARGLRTAGALPLPALMAPPARRLCGPASLSVPSFLAPYLALCTTISADYGHEESAARAKKPVCTE